MLQKQLNLDLEVKCKQFLKNERVNGKEMEYESIQSPGTHWHRLFILQGSLSLLLVFAFN